MPEESNRTLNYFSSVAFKDDYWRLDQKQRLAFQKDWLAGLRAAAQVVDIYQGTASDADLLVWCALPADDPADAAAFFEKLACASAPYRGLLCVKEALWGFTHPSQYSRARSPQEVDPLARERMRYLVMYPFTKTAEWYLMSRESRQGMMNEHIRIGKQFTDIRQLLLYSFGLQDQEFIVVYETDDLAHFSDLVNELRDTEARRYTLQDTPVTTAVYHPAEETLALWK